MEEALRRLCEKAESAVKGGSAVLVLSDRGVSGTQAAIPSLLATASVHHHLVRAGIRTATTLVVETAEAREVHHFALLVGYGATAVNPYLAFETHGGARGLATCWRASGLEEAAKELRQGHRQGPAQGHLQDGHLDALLVLRGPDLRGRRPEPGGS